MSTPATDPNAASLAEVSEGFAASPARRMPGKSMFADFFDQNPDALVAARAKDGLEPAQQPTARTTQKPNETKNDAGHDADGGKAIGDGHPSDHKENEGSTAEGDENLQEDEKNLGGPEGGDAGRAFKTLKTRLREARAQLKTEISKRDEQIKALQSAKGQAETPAELATIRAELETVRKERDELNQSFKAALYKHTPAFVKKYSEGRNSILELAGASFPKEIADEAKAILAMPPGTARDAAMERVSDGRPAVLARLDNLALQLDKLALDQRQEEQEADKRYDEYISRTRTDQENSRKAKQKEFEDTFNAALQKIQDKANGVDIFYPKSDPKEESERQEIINMAKRAWNGSMNAEQLATLQLWGSGFPAALKQMIKLREGLDAALSKIKRLEGATPGVGGGADTGGSAEPTAPKEGESMAEYAARLNPTGRFARR